MAYIGNTPAEAFSAFQKQDFSTSATTSYTLDHPVSNQNEIALFINFVRQEPTAAYTASGTTLTLTSATSSSDDMYCVYLGKAVQTVNPPSGSVGSSQVAASIITGQTALGATPDDTDELLISDAGTLKRVDYSYLKVSNTPIFSAYFSSDLSIANNTFTKVAFSSEKYDPQSKYDSSTNYRFTPAESGKYLINAFVRQGYQNDAYNVIAIYKNGSVYKRADAIGDTSGVHSPQITAFVDSNTTDYFEIFFFQQTGGTVSITGGEVYNTFEAFKIIGA